MCSSDLAQSALQQVARTFSLPGAVEDDHRFLVNAEDDINRAIVLNNRQRGEVSADASRLSTYVARERPGLNQLANSIATGQLAPGTQVGSASRVIEESQTRPRGGISSGPLDQPTRSAVSRTAPSRTAPSRVAQASSQGLGTARRPLVTIRFDRPNPAYEQPLYTAVSRALEIGRAHV